MATERGGCRPQFKKKVELFVSLNSELACMQALLGSLQRGEHARTVVMSVSILRPRYCAKASSRACS